MDNLLRLHTMLYATMHTVFNFQTIFYSIVNTAVILHTLFYITMNTALIWRRLLYFMQPYILFLVYTLYSAQLWILRLFYYILSNYALQVFKNTKYALPSVSLLIHTIGSLGETCLSSVALPFPARGNSIQDTVCMCESITLASFSIICQHCRREIKRTQFPLQTRSLNLLRSISPAPIWSQRIQTAVMQCYSALFSLPVHEGTWFCKCESMLKQSGKIQGPNFWRLWHKFI